MPLRRLRPATVPAPARVPALLAALALCALLAPTTARAQARRPMSFEDMMRLNQVSDAQLSPDGKWVAYVVAHNDMDKDATLRDIYVVGATGGEPVRFTASGKSDASPRWSPDGKWIAFISTRGEHPQVYLISATGGEATPLTDSRSGVNSFAWSPDGTRIAYVAARAPTAEEEKKQKDKDDAFAVDHDYRYTRIWTIDVATKKATEIVSGDFQANNPDWSPDGQWIAFTEAPTPRADDGQLTDLYVVSSTGGTPRKLFSNDGPDNAPRWSPDGKSIAFLTRVGKVATVGQLQLAIISPDGGTPRMVAPSFAYQPGPATWSHDGNTLYFEAPVRTTSQLFSVSAQGGTPRQLTNVQGVISSATFSRDDRTAAFVESDAQHPGDVYVAQLGD
ncbi:MAG TPA: LpqB family beta-propeller domain-containing protein, partial [Gemmatimonadaceae bacterium]|nr:LpqB family beta-propeller domain-containing protein [Gemmatimonadaceae bacterium]